MVSPTFSSGLTVIQFVQVFEVVVYNYPKVFYAIHRPFRWTHVLEFGVIKVCQWNNFTFFQIHFIT